MNYQRLFELSIVHDYYRSQICPDLSIEPTPECRQILAGHHLMVKNKINGILMIAPVNEENKPYIELAKNLPLTFFVTIKNLRFLDYTDIDPKYPRTSTGRYLYSFSNEKQTKTGPYNLKKTLISWSDIKQPQGQILLGIVTIYNNSSLPKVLDQPSEYIISFQAKKHYWYYYLILDSKTNGDDFLIEDGDNHRAEKITFTKQLLTQANQDAAYILFGSQFADKPLYMFKSEQEITCREERRQNIQLLKKSDTGSSTVWINHLPNPPDQTGMQVINALKSV